MKRKRNGVVIGNGADKPPQPSGAFHPPSTAAPIPGARIPGGNLPVPGAPEGAARCKFGSPPPLAEPTVNAASNANHVVGGGYKLNLDESTLETKL